jgi:hypothetical protein
MNSIKNEKGVSHCGFRCITQSSEAKRVDSPRIGEAVHYDFKLCSKLIHQSALMLKHPEMTIRSDDHKAHLRIEVLLYAWVIVIRFHDLNWLP